jgi:hypothetical protein
MYAKIAVALIDGHIDIHQALRFQSETKHGKHTARSGLFLRDFPGRLILYPLEAATCAVIFFGGDWYDAGIAAVTGLTAGIVEWGLGSLNNNSKILLDILVGIAVGIVGGLFYRFDGEQACLPAVFLGTLYWFFYGTAFVIGKLCSLLLLFTRQLLGNEKKNLVCPCCSSQFLLPKRHFGDCGW